MTPEQLRIMHHTLGLSVNVRASYRNHFLAGPGHHDMPVLESLEQAGMMKRAPTPAFCRPSDVVFVCTAAGQKYAIDNLPPEPKRTKYKDFLDSDVHRSFAEYLNINQPMLEQRFSARLSCYEFRMYRLSCYRGWHSVEVSGDWKLTKKEAKASYKAALLASKGRAP